MTMKLKKDKVFKASYTKDLIPPDKNWFVDEYWFNKIPWMNEPQLEQTISIQT